MAFKSDQNNGLQILNSKRLVDTFLKVENTTLRFRKYDNTWSKALDRIVIRKSSSVGVLLYHVDRKRIILIEQFRYPTWEDDGGWIVEIVAGNIDDDASAEDTVRREVLEETGYRIAQFTPIGQGYSSPGINTEKVYLYFAEVDDTMKVQREGGLAEEGEDIKIVEWTIPQVKEKILTHSILDLKTLCALQWFVMNKVS